MTLGEKVVILREGQVHQVGPPEAIYNRPADTFVATFVGSPVMNLLKGKIIREGRNFTFHHGDFSLNVGSIPPNMEGAEVEVGMRPEDIECGEAAKTHLRAEIEMMSNVGADQYLHARLGEAPLTFRALKDAQYSVGEVLPIYVDTHKIHIFHKGRRMDWANGA
jgi:multiple sugar transport system ATP-binding protein